ncbi:AimR family lysis-lysogeny pheromone receptor [Virgibacillus sp. NKC19-16]|uniref:AimR family lysis-lysogeny pheromone receptor n=1 Tax=Virgibacillus salidurans TaxID=2831673 RepID=UPI001F43DB12|nr:AimR family lysis-lysogeny pheromone receptor [Virgibacillus sp. NKC19-16]UJL45964.1 AimR family lysis-lysogeny pheromone receptor [Virgibacillus sp. NKC19-16]
MFNSSIITLNEHEPSLKEVMESFAQDYDAKAALQLTRKFLMNTSSDNIRKKGMEFLYVNGFYEDLELLIQKNRESENSSNREWAQVYQLTIDRKLNRCHPSEIVIKAENMKTGEPELNCLLEFVKVTAYYSMNQYSKIGNFLENYQYLFQKIEDRMMISFFTIRLYQIFLTYYLLRNELIMARKYAYRILNQTSNDLAKIDVHIKLGLSYTFDTYFQGMHHLTEALKLAKKHHLTNQIRVIEHQNIPFLSAHFKKVDNIKTDDKSEQAHIEIAKGNYAKAIRILNELPTDSAFKLYYMGKAKQDKKMLLQSYNYFIEKRSDFFFCRLPLRALMHMNV